MPKAWSNKDERKYEHIKEGYEEKGMGEKKAEEIAARTVNKNRREEGRTPNKTTQGTGNPRKSTDEHTRDEVYNEAKQLKIAGRSKMNKSELVRAVRNKKGG